MKRLSTLVLGAVALGVGAAGVAVYDQFYWNEELRTQLAEKDKTIAILNQDIVNLRHGLAGLSDRNAAMMTLVDASMDDTAALAKSNQSSLERVQSVIKRLAKLQSDLRAQETPLPAASN